MLKLEPCRKKRLSLSWGPLRGKPAKTTTSNQNDWGRDGLHTRYVGCFLPRDPYDFVCCKHRMSQSSLVQITSPLLHCLGIWRLTSLICRRKAINPNGWFKNAESTVCCLILLNFRKHPKLHPHPVVFTWNSCFSYVPGLHAPPGTWRDIAE